MPVAATVAADIALTAINRRNARRLLPVLMIGYVLNTLDKSNIGFASLEMNRDLGFSPAVFGLGAGLFFLTYTLFEIPSNLLMRRVGARLWLSRILISWGVVSMAMALTSGKTSFYALRLLLGLAEAGWYPGVIYFLTMWFPKEFRARAITLFVLGVPLAAIIGSPISGALLTLQRIAGLANWQWLFIVEGLPTVLLGLAAIYLLRDTPAKAEWLSVDERQTLVAALASEATASRGDGVTRVQPWGLLAMFCVINFFNALGLYSTSLWLPRAIKELGALSNLATGFAAAVPFVFSAIALVAAAWSSDRLGERKWHVIALFAVGAVGMAATAVSGSPLASLGWLTVAIMGGFGAQATLYAMFSETLSRIGGTHSLAAALAAITTVGNFGGFFGPYVVGLMREASGSFHLALFAIAATFAAVAVLTLTMRGATLGSRPLAVTGNR